MALSSAFIITLAKPRETVISLPKSGASDSTLAAGLEYKTRLRSRIFGAHSSNSAIRNATRSVVTFPTR